MKPLPRIEVTFLSILAKIAGTAKLVLDLVAISTIADLLRELEDRMGMEFNEKVLSHENGLNPFVLVLVNGVDTRSNGGLNTPLKDGDRIDFLPAIAGG